MAREVEDANSSLGIGLALTKDITHLKKDVNSNDPAWNDFTSQIKFFAQQSFKQTWPNNILKKHDSHKINILKKLKQDKIIILNKPDKGRGGGCIK